MDELRIATKIAEELVQTQTDPNEVAKAFTYLRTHRDGRQFFKFLGTLVTEGGSLVRSERTLDYYRSIRQVCEKYLKPYLNRPDEMAQILGWAVRLMRYYAVEPTLTPPEEAMAPPKAMPLAQPKSIRELRPGMLVRGRVVRIQPYGAFVDIGVGKDGLLHISELAEGPVKDVTDVVSVGQGVIVRIKDVDVKGRRISLSIKGVKQEQEGRSDA